MEEAPEPTSRESDELRREMFNAYRAEQFRRELSNSENYDKAILTYASGALGLSLTFGKELVPFALAHHLWILELSWGAWVVAIIAVVSSYLFAAPASEFQIELADRYYNGEEDDAFNAPNKWTRYTKWANRTAGGAFVIGAVLTVSFVCTNLENSQMSDDKKQGRAGDVNVIVGITADAAIPAGLAPMPANFRTKASIPAAMARVPTPTPSARAPTPAPAADVAPVTKD